MSAKETFALCLDCWELHYGVPDRNGVFTRDSESSNHDGHAVHVFGSPAEYPAAIFAPVRQVLADLAIGLPVSDARINLFSLCCAVNAIQPNNGVKVNGAPVGIAEHERRKGRSCGASEPQGVLL